MFLKCIRLSRAVPVTCAALATFLMVSLQAQAPATATPPAKSAADANLPSGARDPRSARQGHRRTRGGAVAQVGPRHGHLQRALFRHGRNDRDVRRVEPQSHPGADLDPGAGRDGQRIRRFARLGDDADDGPDAAAGQGTGSGQARRRLLQRAARPEEVHQHQDRGEDRVRGQALLQDQPDAHRRQRGLRVLRRRERSARRWHQHPRIADGQGHHDQRRRGLQEIRQHAARPRRWCRR